VKYVLALAVLLAIAVGIAGMVLGEADDSPGLQGLGLLLIIGAIALGVRTVRRRRAGPDAPGQAGRAAPSSL
jgi:uncharacterized membrane-anchored protein